jgi:hypothetical protein
VVNGPDPVTESCLQALNRSFSRGALASKPVLKRACEYSWHSAHISVLLTTLINIGWISVAFTSRTVVALKLAGACGIGG